MYPSSARGAMNAYQSVDTYGGVESADPHRLIEMLLSGALSRIASAKGHIGRGEVAEKGALIGKAIAIIDGLRTSLDKPRGGDLADNLDNLYEYMQQRLAVANAENNIEILDEVTSLMTQIKDAWSAIPQDVRTNPQSAAA